MRTKNTPEGQNLLESGSYCFYVRYIRGTHESLSDRIHAVVQVIRQIVLHDVTNGTCHRVYVVVRV